MWSIYSLDFQREIVNSALAVYIEKGLSVKNPVQCLDLSIAENVGVNWRNIHGSSVHVISSEISSNKCNFVSEDTKESKYALIERTDFNFLYVECTTDGSSYFDCVFRKIARNGLFAISTIDDPALYGRPAEPALRCYSGNIVRTFYASEMAVRLIVAAMARSAARFSKSIEVLLAAAIKSTVTILVRVTKGAESAVKCLKNVKTLAHCSVCEERAFLPDNDGFILDDVRKHLSCDCASKSVGRTIMALGPLWAGSIGSALYVTSMLPHAKHSLHLSRFLQDLIIELRCGKESAPTADGTNAPNSNVPSTLNALKRKSEVDHCEIKRKKPCLELSPEPDPAPVFYYNLHKHKPKGCQNLLKADVVINTLKQLGYRSSRTHFDRAAVKTNCSLRELQAALCQMLEINI